MSKIEWLGKNGVEGLKRKRKGNIMSGEIKTFVPRDNSVKGVCWTGGNLPIIEKFIGHYGFAILSLGALIVTEFGDCSNHKTNVKVGHYIVVYEGGLYFFGKEEMNSTYKRVEERWGLYDTVLKKWAIGYPRWISEEIFPFNALEVDERAECLADWISGKRYELRSKLIEIKESV